MTKFCLVSLLLEDTVLYFKYENDFFFFCVGEGEYAGTSSLVHRLHASILLINDTCFDKNYKLNKVS